MIRRRALVVLLALASPAASAIPGLGPSEVVLPPQQLPLQGPVSALSTSVEGRYTLRPGLYAAARVDHLGFSEIVGATAGTLPWDAPVSRVEIGGGDSIQRNLLLKVSAQIDRRDGGRTRKAHMVAGQLVFWF